MTIDINELRIMVNGAQFESFANSVIHSLLDRIEMAEKERDALRTNLDDHRALVFVLRKEVEKLRAKVAEMEKQEPVAWARKLGMDLPSFGCVTDLKYRPSDMPESAYMPLYALPGAQPAPSLASGDVSLISEGKTQPAPSVPEDVMRDAERYRYLRARDDGTAGVGCWIEAEGRACDRGWLYGVQLDSAIDTCIEMLAASPEAKP